jgi:hypothetical protein
MRRSGFPVHLFDMIRRHGQLMAAMFTTRFKNTPTGAGLHTLTKPMNPFAAANFRLPGALG